MTIHDLDQRPTATSVAAEGTTTAQAAKRRYDRPDVARPTTSPGRTVDGDPNPTPTAQGSHRPAPTTNEEPSFRWFGSVDDDGPRFPRFARAVRRTPARKPAPAVSEVPEDHETPDLASSADVERPAPRIRRVHRIAFLILAILVPWVGFHLFKEDPPVALSTDSAAMASGGDPIVAVDPAIEDGDSLVASSAPALSPSDDDASGDGESAAPYEYSPLQSFPSGVSVAAAGNPTQESLIAPYEHSSSGLSSLPQAGPPGTEVAGRSAKNAVVSTVEMAVAPTHNSENTVVDTPTSADSSKLNSAENAVDQSLTVATAVEPRTTMQSETHLIQLGSFGSDQNAKEGWAVFREKLEPLLDFVDPYFEVGEIGGATRHRLKVGPFATSKGAGSFCAEIRRRGFDCFVVRGTENG